MGKFKGGSKIQSWNKDLFNGIKVCNDDKKEVDKKSSGKWDWHGWKKHKNIYKKMYIINFIYFILWRWIKMYALFLSVTGYILKCSNSFI